MRIMVVRADFGTYTDVFRKEGYVAIGWFDEELEDPLNKDEIRVMYKKVYPDDAGMRVHQNVGQIHRFMADLAKGDIVITPYRDHRLLIGKVQDAPYFEKDSLCPYYYRRHVTWMSEEIDRTSLSIPLQNTLRSSLTIFNVSQKKEVLVAIGEPIPPEDGVVSPGPEAISDEEVYKAIKAHFLQLDPTEFELLVSYLLMSLGFEAKQRTGKVGDGGIDYEGELSVMGIASINLQVQVKRYTDSTIGEKDIRSFRGAIKKDHQGCFITLSQFSKPAVQSASDPEKVAIKLINGERFVELFIEQYERIMEALRDDDTDELADKLKFKKALLPA